MRSDQLDRLFTLSRPDLHPDGWAVLSATRPDFAADAYVGQLWRVPLDGGAPRRITRGFHDTDPQVSPDGRWIAFRRQAPDQPAQLAVVAADGGEPAVFTDRQLGVKEFAWLGDSRRLVFTSPVPEPGRYGTLEGVDAAAEDPRHITNFQFQLNGDGFLNDKRTHVFLVEAPDPAAEPPVQPVGRAAQDLPPQRRGKAFGLPATTQLTSGDADHHHLHAAGEVVLAVAPRHAGHDHDLREDVYRVPLDGGDPTLVYTPDPAHQFGASAPVLTGDTVWFLAQDLGSSGVEFTASDEVPYRVPLAGGQPQRLGDPAEVQFLALVPDGTAEDHVLGVIFSRGRGLAVRIDADGSLTRLDTPPDASVQALAADGSHVVATVTTPRRPAELARLGAEPARLTDFSADLLAVVQPIVPQELIAPSTDGAAVHGWVLVPPGPGPHPVLLTIHGGPHWAYSDAFFDEAQVCAAAGYAVVMSNPRGSASYGAAWGKAIHRAYGTVDATDVLAFLDHALATVPGLDPDRVGVQGGSYGGYLGAWLIGHSDRFRAAIVERGYLDMRSDVGASDIGWFFVREEHGTDPALIDAQSPTLVAGDVTTPTLVLHSERDLRCPVSQGLRYYTELKLAGVEAELLLFPGESHELTRSGRPWHRRQRFDAVLDWWRRHLPLSETP
ncbi:MAG: S9 family peptidase [Propionibacteriaceae bacterium]|jgi:dipeptidyl aminopeptidase/acylaminoacyl peptidase|nr:S9 family peptidase [Propionibacteriaceae bacterium]